MATSGLGVNALVVTNGWGVNALVVANGCGVNASVVTNRWGINALVMTSGCGVNALMVTNGWGTHALVVSNGKIGLCRSRRISKAHSFDLFLWVDLYRLRMLALLARNKDGDPRAASKSSSNGPTGLGVRNADTLKGVSGVETLKTRTETIILLHLQKLQVT